MLCHPAAALFRLDCSANLSQRAGMNMLKVSDLFASPLPGASLLGGFVSLIGGFISLLARSGNSLATVLHFNDLRAFERPLRRPGTRFCQYFPADEGNRRSVDSRRAPAVLRARAV